MALAFRGGVKSRSGFEMTSWYFFRLSGVLLIVLALGHIFITHYLNAPSFTTFDFVAARWVGPLWRTFDWLLLVLALLHGLNGLRVVIDDYVHPAGWRILAQSVNASLAIIFIGLGSVTIFTFDPVQTLAVTDLTACHVMDGLLVAIAIITYLVVAGIIVWVGSSLARGGLPVYLGDAGQWAWVLHRITGLGVVFFLLLHIIDIMFLGLGPTVYDCTVSFYATPVLIPMEIALVAALVYHAVNGVRIILVNFWAGGTRHELQLFYAVLILSVLMVAPSVYVLIAEQ